MVRLRVGDGLSLPGHRAKRRLPSSSPTSTAFGKPSQQTDRILDKHQVAATISSMAKKQHDAEPITTAVRKAIERSGLTRYQISQATGIDQGSLSRFVRGQRGLNTTSLDKLALLLGFRIVERSKPKGKA
jgi:ribosome-binding protein aMBF1 (putative translation factor)